MLSDTRVIYLLSHIFVSVKNCNWNPDLQVPGPMTLERMSQEEEYRSGTCRMQRRKYITGGEETV